MKTLAGDSGTPPPSSITPSQPLRNAFMQGAMNVAYFLFATVGVTVALVAVTVVQELSK